MGNLGGERGGAAGGKHLSLDKYGILEASLESNPHAHLVPKHGGEQVGPWLLVGQWGDPMSRWPRGKPGFAREWGIRR